ncbi:WD40-repeat-containing domain protein [Pyronema omphalodes]|nr:WD40-repeat-containing domain protein [Pyronema omphalodes]
MSKLSDLKKPLGATTSSSSYVHFPTGHEDLVHDVAYDYYGRRMATVSADQRLKIFDKDDNGEWSKSGEVKAHDASIVKVIWGPPEHGQILATCSYDRHVRIWEEQEMEPKLSPHRWKRQFQMTAESRTAVLSIAFPPTQASSSSSSTGLKIAFISTDGTVSIYECREPHDLSHWVLVDSIKAIPTPPPSESEVAFCLAFCPSRWGGEQLVVGAMDTVRVYRHNAAGKFRAAEELPGHGGLVRDVAWAVTMGRNYHLIATACKDGHVRIFKLTSGGVVAVKPVQQVRTISRKKGAGLSQGLGGEEPEGDGEEVTERWNVEKVADFGDHRSEVWKVAWNATGTILSSTGDDGKIRLWKAAINGEFQLLGIVATPKSG